MNEWKRAVSRVQKASGPQGKRTICISSWTTRRRLRETGKKGRERVKKEERRRY